VVAPRRDQQPDRALVAVADEVAAILAHLFVLRRQLLSLETMQVAELRAHHDRHEAEAHLDALRVALAHLHAEHRAARALVRARAFAALGWVEWPS